MFRYFKNSYIKFKGDFLSKVFYDCIKGLVVAVLALFLTNYIPKNFKLGQILREEVTVSIYTVTTYTTGVAAIAILTLWLIFSRRYANLKRSLQTDDLTNLRNYNALNEGLPLLINQAVEGKLSFSLILLDVDDFKKFNDQQGYNEADQMLAKLGELLLNDSRASDEAYRKYVRGDEFVIIAKQTNLSDALRAAERKRLLIQDTTLHTKKGNYKLTVSCGVTQYKSGDDPKTILDRANMALLEAKKISGKNTSRTIV